MEPQVKYKEKSVIIHRDENGFGLRVGGQNPVFVDCVHENGAAWKAGVRKDDRIIKVNGTLVRSFDHQQVVHMIQNCTPFVNLTLHSPEPITTETFTILPSGLQSIEPTMGGSIILANNSPNNNLGRNNSNVHSHQRLHHPASNISDWLLDIGDDLFQDNQQKSQSPQKLQSNQDSLAVSPSQQHSGLSKLVASGTSPVISINPQSNSGGKPKLKQNHSQSSIRDNPYYYYKNASDKNEPSASSNANSSLFSQESSSKVGSSLSIVRSRSSSKMSIRSTTGKYKPRNLRSRLVEDLRSLAITNTQATPSSLSTSPSSSDLSDCDDADSSRLDCLSVNTSNTSASGMNSSLYPSRSPSCTSGIANSSGTSAPRPKYTTRRLEIIRELVDTEKTHTERLKHLNDLLYKPIKAEGLVPLDQLKMVFSCHKTLFKIHRQIYKILHAAQINLSENHQEPLIGKALAEIFEGELGRRLERAASTFCACQSTNTELLNRFTRKDTKAGEFLAQVANQQMLGRLGIKDLLASCFQRLTKYPLLLENLLKATPTGAGVIHSKSLSEGSIAANLAASLPVSTNQNKGTTNVSERPQKKQQTVNGDKEVNASKLNNNNDDSTTTRATPSIDDEYAYERLCISRALHQTRQILTRVNEAVKRAISHNQLREIWKKTDKYPSLPVIDIETQQLLHEGPLTLRLARRTFEVYVLLLTHYLVILTREGQDKYKLKYFTADNKSATQLSPIFNIDEHLATRDTATDENGFYLLCKRKDDSRIYEFASQSPAERSRWKEMIHSAQLYNFAAAPDDDNTLTRYRELITLATSSNTPNNIEHNGPLAINMNSSSSNLSNIATISAQSSTSLNESNCTQVSTSSSASTTTQPITLSNNIGHDLNVRAQDV